MEENGLPTAVAGFIKANITSVELLEVLLLLCREAAELRIQPRSTATRLDALTKLGVLKETERQFRFDAGCALCPVVEALAKTYQTHRVAVIQLIFSRPPNGVEAFANAFLIGGKKEKSDG